MKTLSQDQALELAQSEAIPIIYRRADGEIDRINPNGQVSHVCECGCMRTWTDIGRRGWSYDWRWLELEAEYLND